MGRRRAVDAFAPVVHLARRHVVAAATHAGPSLRVLRRGRITIRKSIFPRKSSIRNRIASYRRQRVIRSSPNGLVSRESAVRGRARMEAVSATPERRRRRRRLLRTTTTDRYCLGGARSLQLWAAALEWVV